MTSRLTSSQNKEKLLKDRNASLRIGIGISCVLSGLFLYLALEEFYKLKTLIVCQCRIESIDLKYSGNNYFPRWNLTIIDGNETTNQVLLQSIGSKSDRWAWIKARKYRINETYPCYRSRDRKSILRWNLQWNKPNGYEVIIYFSLTILFFLLLLLVIQLKQHYQIQFKQIEQLNIQEKNEEI